MKIGVMADTHDHMDRIRQAVELFRRRGVGHVVHAGDFVAPFAIRPLAQLSCPVLAVLGNNDGEVTGLTGAFREIGDLHARLATTRIEGRRIAAVHYPELAEPLATGGRFDLVAYGHTHEVAVQRIGETLLLNPGEVCGWVTGRATVAVVDLETMEEEIVELPPLGEADAGTDA